MLNDSIVNFYMNYTLTEHIRDRLRLHHIDESDAETLLRKEHLSDPSLEEHVKKVLNEELLTFHVFSTFLYPQLGKLRRIDNGETKKKLRKWCENAAIFQRRCVFFPRGSSIRKISFRSFIQYSRSVAASESSVFETKTGMSTGSETAGSELSVKNANKSRIIQQLMCHL